MNSGNGNKKGNDKKPRAFRYRNYRPTGYELKKQREAAEAAAQQQQEASASSSSHHPEDVDERREEKKVKENPFAFFSNHGRPALLCELPGRRNPDLIPSKEVYEWNIALMRGPPNYKRPKKGEVCQWVLQREERDRLREEYVEAVWNETPYERMERERREAEEEAERERMAPLLLNEQYPSLATPVSREPVYGSRWNRSEQQKEREQENKRTMWPTLMESEFLSKPL